MDCKKMTFVFQTLTVPALLKAVVQAPLRAVQAIPRAVVQIPTYGWGLQIPDKEVEPFLSADCKSAGTPSGLALLITPSGLTLLITPNGLAPHKVNIKHISRLSHK